MSRRQHIFTSDIIRLYVEEQMSTHAIAERLRFKGVVMTAESVRNVLIRNGIPTRSPKEAAKLRKQSPYSAADDEKIKELWPTGMQGQEMLKHISAKVDVRSLYHRAKCLGMKPRYVMPPRLPKSGKEIASLAVATVAAKRFIHESVIHFDQPHLQAAFEQEVAKVRKMRAWA